MYDLNDVKEKPAVGRQSLLFLKMRRITLLVTGILLVLLISGLLLLLRESSSLQQKITKLQQDISHYKSINAIDAIEREWVNYADDIARAAYLMDVRSAWGGRLSILSRTIPRGLCLDFVSASVLPSDRSRKLMTLETIVLTQERPGSELAGSFIEQLRNEKEYGREIKINYEQINDVDGQDMEYIQIQAKVP
jgi:hypothetical protein